MDIGLIIVGDEILSGRRTDKHLGKVIELLNARDMCLSWVRILGDSPADLVACYRDSFASDALVFSTGGIGATPDDLTRTAVATALNSHTERHPEGAVLLEEFAQKNNRELTPERYRLIEFPAGSELIPNPYNGIPGFKIDHHHFVPGFPEMAWPMMEWVLDTHYPTLGNDKQCEHSLFIQGASESRIIPVMESIQISFMDVKTFSLPILGDNPRIELGVKGPQLQAKYAFDEMKKILSAEKIEWLRN